MFEKQLYLKTDLVENTNLALKTHCRWINNNQISFISKATLATFLVAPVHKILFPAMNHFMYHNKGFQNNLLTLVNNDDVTIIKPETGMLACNIVGEGRLSEPDLAYQIITKKFSNNIIATNKTVLINYGGTRTYLDPIRYITNNSSGKIGQAFVKELLAVKARVIAVVGDTDQATNTISSLNYY